MALKLAAKALEVLASELAADLTASAHCHPRGAINALARGGHDKLDCSQSCRLLEEGF